MRPRARPGDRGNLRLQTVTARMLRAPFENDMTLVCFSLIGADLSRPPFFLVMIAYHPQFTCEILLVLFVEAFVSTVVFENIGVLRYIYSLHISSKRFRHALIYTKEILGDRACASFSRSACVFAIFMRCRVVLNLLEVENAYYK